MTYLRRALKYFIQICLIFAIIIGILILSGMVSKDISVAFRRGWDSIFMILGIFAVMSAAYPFFGYGKRNILAYGDPADYTDAIKEAMALRGYILTGEEDGEMCFRLSSPLNRAARLWEDSIRIKPQLGGFQAEGLIRDLARAVSSINYKIKEVKNDH